MSLFTTNVINAQPLSGTSNSVNSQSNGSGFNALLAAKLAMGPRTLSAGSSLIDRSEIPTYGPGSPGFLKPLESPYLDQAAARRAYRHTATAENLGASGLASGNFGSYAPGAGYEMLGEAISSYSGSRFAAPVELGQAQAVGAGIEQFHFPHMVEKDGAYYAYFIDHTGGSQNDVGLATSTDGVNFEYQGKVLTKGESGFDAAQASFPAVQYDSETGLWYMLYEAKADHDDINSVCLATSTDGVTWEKKGPVISPGDGGEFSKVDVGTPTMFKEDGQWHVYFHGLADDGRVRIGYARGADLENLQVTSGPLLDTDAEGMEAGTVGARSNVVKIGDWYYMAYEVCSPVKKFENAQWGTNLARAASPNGPWQKLDGGPLITNSEEGMGMDGPELLLQDDELYLYYRYGGNSTARVQVSGLDNGQAMSMAMQA